MLYNYIHIYVANVCVTMGGSAPIHTACIRLAFAAQKQYVTTSLAGRCRQRFDELEGADKWDVRRPACALTLYLDFLSLSIFDT